VAYAVASLYNIPYESSVRLQKQLCLVTTTLSVQDTRNIILEMLEEDEYGLYEVIWSLNTQHPDAEPAEKVRVAHAAMRELLNEHRVALSRAVWASQARQPIARSDALGLIESPVAWAPPDSDKGEYLVFWRPEVT
jgi:hypothetical protein